MGVLQNRWFFINGNPIWKWIIGGYPYDLGNPHLELLWPENHVYNFNYGKVGRAAQQCSISLWWCFVDCFIFAIKYQCWAHIKNNFFNGQCPNTWTDHKCSWGAWGLKLSAWRDLVPLPWCTPLHKLIALHLLKWSRNVWNGFSEFRPGSSGSNYFQISTQGLKNKGADLINTGTTQRWYDPKVGR